MGVRGRFAAADSLRMTHNLLTIAVTLAALMVGLPVLTLLHELAHAVAAALAVGGRVTVIQGPAPSRLRFSVWRLDFRLRGPVGPHQVWVGWAVWGGHPDRRRHAIATAAGPAGSLVYALLCAFGASRVDGFAQLFLMLLTLASAGQMLSSGLPVRYGRHFGQFGGQASDGLRIRRLIQGKPEPVPVRVAGY